MGGDQEGTLGAGRCPLLGPREGALEERISHLSCFRTQLQLDKPPWVRGREEAGTGSRQKDCLSQSLGETKRLLLRKEGGEQGWR